MSTVYLSSKHQMGVFWTNYTKWIITGEWKFNASDYNYGTGKFWRLFIDFLGTEGDTGTEGDIISNIAGSIKLSMLGGWKS